MGDSDYVRWPWFTMKLTSNQHQMINKAYLKLLIFFANLVKNPSRTAHSRNFPVAICAPYHYRRRAWLMEFMLKPGQTREQKSTQPCDHHLYRLGVILDSFTLNKTTPNGLSLIVQRESDAVMCAHFLTFPSSSKKSYARNSPFLPSSSVELVVSVWILVYCSGIPFRPPAQPGSRRINSEILCPILTHIKLP